MVWKKPIIGDKLLTKKILQQKKKHLGDFGRDDLHKLLRDDNYSPKDTPSIKK